MAKVQGTKSFSQKKNKLNSTFSSQNTILYNCCFAYSATSPLTDVDTSDTSLCGIYVRISCVLTS